LSPSGRGGKRVAKFPEKERRGGVVLKNPHPVITQTP